MNAKHNTAEILDALDWYAQMGVDLCVENDPQAVNAGEKTMPGSIAAATNSRSPLRKEPDRSHDSAGKRASQKSSYEFAKTNSTPRQAESRSIAPAAAPPASASQAVAEARALADHATSLAELENAVRGFNGCGLKKTATNTVFAQGVAASRLMFIGEAPGADEDRKGVPFCGVSGQLLDKMLGFIGLDRAENFYITNTLFWRPPGNRQPTKEELEICRPFVEKHIALVNPKILVLVGGTAASAMLKDTRGITRLRGQVFSYQNDYMQVCVPVHVLYHPSYLLRQPLAKKQAWADLLALKDALASA